MISCVHIPNNMCRHSKNMSWGPAYWRFIHYFALNNKDRTLLTQLPNFLPCDECKGEWEDPLDDEDLVQWSMRLHNKVNKKLGKWDKWDLTDYNIGHKNTCDYCMNQEYIHFFPWVFVHTIASFEGNALAFLKRFDEVYPCDVCRGQFFLDEPNEGESILEWTIRHHSRMNEERGLPPYIHPIDTSGNSSGCEGCETSAQVPQSTS
jgi:hypothetical protein